MSTHPVYGVLTMETEAVVVVTKYFLTARIHVMIKKQMILGMMGFFFKSLQFFCLFYFGFCFIGKREKQKQEAGVQSEKKTHVHTPLLSRKLKTTHNQIPYSYSIWPLIESFIGTTEGQT